MDPRASSPVAPLMAGAAVLCPGLIRVVAPNPSALTLDGTNTYVAFGADRRGIVVDPGPAIASHLELLSVVVESEGIKVDAVVTTHSHPDHSEALEEIGERLAARPIKAEDFRSEAARSRLSPWFTVVLTPGHSSDHVCYLTGDGALLTGDHVLGRGTTAVLYPDGNLADYLASLSRITEIDFSLIAPGHGPSLEAPLARATLRYYLAHRLERIEQVLAVVKKPASLEAIVKALYGVLLDPQLDRAATASTLAAVNYLIERGSVSENEGRFYAASR